MSFFIYFTYCIHILLIYPLNIKLKTYIKYKKIIYNLKLIYIQIFDVTDFLYAN